MVLCFIVWNIAAARAFRAARRCDVKARALISGHARTGTPTRPTAGGWAFGITGRQEPDPNKLPVILCHGLGLNATFWTITDDHLPSQLTSRGYDVYVFDIRGSGENARPGPI